MSFNSDERKMVEKAAHHKNSSSEIYLQFQGFAKRIIKNQFCWNITDPEDLVQETILKAIKNESKFENGSNLKNWLFTIMINTNRDIKKKNRTNKKSPYESGLSVSQKDLQSQVTTFHREGVKRKIKMETLDDSMNPIYYEDQVRENELGEKNESNLNLIYKLVEELNQVDRDIFHFIAQEEMSSSQVGKILNMSPNTIRTKYSRIVSRFKYLANQRYN